MFLEVFVLGCFLGLGFGSFAGLGWVKGEM
jgi:hypothetical protein